MIRIKRDEGYVDKFRAYKIVLDDLSVGEVKDGQEIELVIAPGKHRIYLKIDWCRTNIIEFEVEENETIEFDCGSNLRGLKLWIPFMQIIYITIKRNQYIWLRLKERTC